MKNEVGSQWMAINFIVNTIIKKFICSTKSTDSFGVYFDCAKSNGSPPHRVSYEDISLCRS